MGRYEGEWKRGKYEGQGIYSLAMMDDAGLSNDSNLSK